MKDFLKKLLGLAAIGGAIAAVVYYFKKNDATEDDFEDDFEDDDFDLDEDLKPVSDRGYVSLTPAVSEKAEEASEEETAEEGTTEA